MASTRPNWALNFPSGPTYHEKWISFDSDIDVSKFNWTIIGGVGAEQCGWQGSIEIQDELHGSLKLTNDANDNDSIIGQLRYETIKFSGLGKTHWIVGRMKVSDATQSDFMFGVWKRDTVPLGGTDGASDGIWFRKDDGDAYIDSVRAYNAATFPDDYSQDTAIGTMTTSYITYAIRVITDATTTGTATIQFYLDGNVAGSAISTTNLVADEELALGFGIMNGEAAAKTLTVESVGYLIER